MKRGSPVWHCSCKGACRGGIIWGGPQGSRGPCQPHGEGRHSGGSLLLCAEHCWPCFNPEAEVSCCSKFEPYCYVPCLSITGITLATSLGGPQATQAITSLSMCSSEFQRDGAVVSLRLCAGETVSEHEARLVATGPLCTWQQYSGR